MKLTRNVLCTAVVNLVCRKWNWTSAHNPIHVGSLYILGPYTLPQHGSHFAPSVAPVTDQVLSLTSHIVMLSAALLATRLSSGDIVTGAVTPNGLPTNAPFSKCQMHAMRSQPATINPLSLKNVTVDIILVCPGIVRISCVVCPSIANPLTARYGVFAASGVHLPTCYAGLLDREMDGQQHLFEVDGESTLRLCCQSYVMRLVLDK